MEIAIINTPVGLLEIKGSIDGLSSITYLNEEKPVSTKIPLVLQETVSQLNLYFKGELDTFTVILQPQGTDFQKTVWNKLLEIPFGKTANYLEIAKRLGDPKVIRAAASANGKNPISIIIPCHRVIGSDGSLTGYAGGLHRKKWLLEHESPVKQGSLF